MLKPESRLKNDMTCIPSDWQITTLSDNAVLNDCLLFYQIAKM